MGKKEERTKPQRGKEVGLVSQHSKRRDLLCGFLDLTFSFFSFFTYIIFSSVLIRILHPRHTYCDAIFYTKSDSTYCRATKQQIPFSHFTQSIHRTMAKKGTREKSSEQSVSPPPVPTKARAKRAAAAVDDLETADTSALELTPKKKDKKGKKEKKEKKEKKDKSGTLSKRDKKKSSEDVFDDEPASDDAEDNVVHESIRVKHIKSTSGSDSLSSWRLPGALSPYVDNTARALFEAGLFAVASATLSRAARYGVTKHAISSPSFMDSTGWDTLLITSSVQGYWALAASVTARLYVCFPIIEIWLDTNVRRVKHVVGWNDVYALSALNVLISAPMVSALPS